MNSEVKRYWASEYSKGKWIYGKEPSRLAQIIVKFVKCNPSPKILDIGGGYGRDTIYYAQNSFTATCIDISNVAISQGKELASQFKVPVNLIVGGFLEKEFNHNFFDIIVSYHTLYLFSQKDLLRVIDKIYNLLVENGLTSHIMFSKEESTYGKGTEVEKDSYLWEEGKIVHYFDKEGIERLFNKFNTMKLERVNIKEHHHIPHIHKDWFLLATKISKDRNVL